MYKSDYDDEPCGVKLMRLIETRSLAIAKKENTNANKMCLYRTGEYWHGFEHSAYFLARIFPKAESFIINNPNYPFAIVGISILDKDFKKYQLKHDAISRKEDYIEYEVAPFVPLEYGDWHTEKVNPYKDAFEEVSRQNRENPKGRLSPVYE